MNSEFLLGQGAGQKLEFAVKRCGGTSEDIEYLSTGDNFRLVTLLRTGKAKLVLATETESEGADIPTVLTPTEWIVDDDGNIHFTLVSNGLTLKQWGQHFESRGLQITEFVRYILRSASEAPTNGVTYNIVVRPGKLISNRNRITRKIRSAADKKGWGKPHWEVACLIHGALTEEQLEQMGLWYIVTMHEPISDSDECPDLLYSDRRGDGWLLNADYGRPNLNWDKHGGFAFIEPHVGSQT